MDTPAVGTEVFVYWGRFGRCKCKIHHIGKDGRVWALRWIYRWGEWSKQPKSIEWVPYWRNPSVYVWRRE